MFWSIKSHRELPQTLQWGLVKVNLSRVLNEALRGILGDTWQNKPFQVLLQCFYGFLVCNICEPVIFIVMLSCCWTKPIWTLSETEPGLTYSLHETKHWSTQNLFREVSQFSFFSRCLFDTNASGMQILWSQGWKYIPCNILSHIHKIKDAFNFYNVHNFWSYSFLNYFWIVSNIYIFSVYLYNCLILIVKMTKELGTTIEYRLCKLKIV